MSFYLFINELPQDIRFIMHETLMDAFININHCIRETMAAGK